MSGPQSRRGSKPRKALSLAKSGLGGRTWFRPGVEAVEPRILLTVFTVPSAAYPTIASAVAASNAANSTSSEILVSSGTYYESNLVITAPVTLISQNGAGSTTIDGSNPSMHGQMQTTPQDGIIQVTGNSNLVTIGGPGEGFTLQNPPVSSATGDINIIDINNINGPVSVQNNILTGLNGVNNPFDTGILAESTPIGSPITVQSNTFQGMFQGVFFQQTMGAGTVSNNTFQNLYPSTDPMSNHVFEPEGFFALTFGGSAFNVRGLSVTSNNFSNFDGLAVTVDGGYTGYAPAQFSNVQITSNVISSIGFTPATYRAGITLIDDPGTAGTDGSAGGVINSLVQNNTLVAQTSCSNGSVGVWVLGPNNNLTIDNNFIQNLDRGVLIDQQVPGEAFASGVLINQNSITGNNIGVSISNPAADTIPIDASYNYWGTIDATSVRAQADGGIDVDYNPYLGSGTDTSPNAGFQPSLTPAVTDAVRVSGSDSVASGTSYMLSLSQVQNDPHVGTINSYTVNFGDGTVMSFPPGTASHTYTASSQTTYPISVTATNTAGQTFQVANSAAVTQSGVTTEVPNVTAVTVTPAALSGDFLVTMFTPTSSGFHVRFNDLVDTSVLNLYSSPSAPTYSPPDVTVTGPTGTNVIGSLKLDSDGKGFTFVATGPPLANGSYTVTLVGAANGVQDASTGSPLDGAGTVAGAAGSNYVTTFTASTSGPTVSIVDFARGPGQPVILPANGGTGLPIRISDGTNVTSVMLVLTYDPTLLTIDPTTITLSPAVMSSSGGLAQIVYNATIPGRLAICITSPTTLNAGNQDLIELKASIPKSAPYRSKAVLNVQVVNINNSTTFGTGDQTIQVVNYLGNTTGSGAYSSGDASQIQQLLVATITNPGFANFPLVDPRIIGDVLNQGAVNSQGVPIRPSLSSGDASLIQQALVSPTPPPQIPAYTGRPSSFAAGPDPDLFLPQDLAGMPGQTLVVPVELLQTNATPINLQSFNLVLSFDPSAFSVSNIRAGELDLGFSVTATVDEAKGLIIISGSSDQALTLAPGMLGDLVEMDFTILAAVHPTSSGINLLEYSGLSVTSLNGGGLTLVPAPTNSGLDPNDGLVAIGGRRTQSPFAPGRTPSFASSPVVSGSSSTTSMPQTLDSGSTAPLTVVLSDETSVPPSVTPSTIMALPSSVTTPSITLSTMVSLPSSVMPPVRDIAVRLLAARATEPREIASSSLVPLTIFGTSDDTSVASTGSDSSTTATSGLAIASRRVAFRHQALTRIIASTDPSK